MHTLYYKTGSITVPYSLIYCIARARSQSKEERKTGEKLNVETISALDSEPSNMLVRSGDMCITTDR